MLAGHCDEIGLRVSYIDDQGFIWVQPIGGWDPQIAQGQRVQILTKKGIIKGVIGKLAIHLQTPEQKKKKFLKLKTYGLILVLMIKADRVFCGYRRSTCNRLWI